jgi:hypothetical protein
MSSRIIFLGVIVLTTLLLRAFLRTAAFSVVLETQNKKGRNRPSAREKKWPTLDTYGSHYPNKTAVRTISSSSRSLAFTLSLLMRVAIVFRWKTMPDTAE